MSRLNSLSSAVELSAVLEIGCQDVADFDRRGADLSDRAADVGRGPAIGWFSALVAAC